MNVILKLGDGRDIETAARERYEELKAEKKEDDKSEGDEELDFLSVFLDESNFDNLKRFGLDGSKEMEVVVKKEGQDFAISKTWGSVFES